MSFDLDRLFVCSAFAAGFTHEIEGPSCDREGNLYAVAFERGGTIGRVTPDGEATLWLELPPGTNGCGTLFGPDGMLYVADATGHNILRIDTRTRSISVHAHEAAMNQPNDLAIRADGTIFASDPDWQASTGQLWRIATSGAVTLLESGMGTTNGIEVSPDGSILYVNETVQRTIWRYGLDAAGDIHDKRLLIRFDDFGLDGMRADAAGNLYVTRYRKGTVVCLAPTGAVLREIPLTSGTDCSNLAFGGVDGRTVYVTVADDGHVERFRTDLPGRSWVR